MRMREVNRPGVQECILEVSEIIGTDIYYFYATKGTRASLGTGAVVAIASFLIGAFCQGLVECIRNKTKQLGQETAERIWQLVRARLGRRHGDDESAGELKLIALVKETKEIVSKASQEELQDALCRTERILTLVLLEENLPEEKGKSFARRIAETVISEFFEDVKG